MVHHSQPVVRARALDLVLLHLIDRAVLAHRRCFLVHDAILTESNLRAAGVAAQNLDWPISEGR